MYIYTYIHTYIHTYICIYIYIYLCNWQLIIRLIIMIAMLLKFHYIYSSWWIILKKNLELNIHKMWGKWRSNLLFK